MKVDMLIGMDNNIDEIRVKINKIRSKVFEQIYRGEYLILIDESIKELEELLCDFEKLYKII